MLIKTFYHMLKDYDDIYMIDRNQIRRPKLEKMSTITRVLDNKKMDNLFALEPSEMYFLEVDTLDGYNPNEFLRLGLLPDVYKEEGKYFISLFNQSVNIVYLTQETLQ